MRNFQHKEFAILPVDIFAPAQAHYQNAQRLIVDFANDAVLSDSITPEISERPAQCFAHATRVFQRGDAAVHVIEDATSGILVELVELPEGTGRVLNRPGQDVDSLHGR